MTSRRNLTRREMLFRTAEIGVGCRLLGTFAAWSAETALPTDDPTAELGLAWTTKIHWGRVVDITRMSGDTWEARLQEAQKRLAAEGGGVVYFPPGEYRFTESLEIGDGIVLRGANPDPANPASDRYAPAARLEFPKYTPMLSGSGARSIMRSRESTWRTPPGRRTAGW